MEKAEQPSWFGVGIVFREDSGPEPVDSMAQAQEGWALLPEQSAGWPFLEVT